MVFPFSGIQEFTLGKWCYGIFWYDWIGVVGVVSLHVKEYRSANPLTDQFTRKSIGVVPSLSLPRIKYPSLF